MSASRQHKKRVEERAKAALNPKKKQNGSRTLGKALLYTVSVLVLLGFLFLFLSGLGFFEANLTVLTVDGVEIKGTEFNYHYYSTASEYVSLYQSAGMNAPFDTTVSLKSQSYSDTQTWAEYFEEQVLEDLTTIVIQSEQAKAEGIALTEEDRDNIQSVMDSLAEAAENEGTDQDKALRVRYGRGITVEKFQSYLERRYLSSRYKTTVLDSYERTDEDLEKYYSEHRDEYDSVRYHTYAFDKAPETADDEEAPTEEELEAYEKEQKKKAEEMLSKVTTSEAFLALSKEYPAEEDEEEESADEEDDPTLEDTAVSSLSEPYTEYLSDTSRKAQDKTLLEDDDSYYVVLFVSRTRSETENADVRHILAGFPEAEEAEDDSDEDDTSDEVSEADKTATKARADAILEEWKAGDQTSESFAALATEKTDDTGSAENGGLYTNIAPTSGYVQPFLDWIFEAGRKVGDTGVIETEYGYHVMYMEKIYPPEWKVDVEDAMNTADYDAKYAEISEGKESKTNSFALLFTKND